MKTSFKKLTSLALTALMLFSLASCAGQGEGGNTTDTSATSNVNDSITTSASTETDANTEALAPEKINIAVLGGPTGMGAAKLMSDGSGEGNPEYAFTVATAPDQIGPALLKGEYDIAAVPTNLAATLYQKSGGNIMVTAVNTGGVLYVLENGESINSVEDLRGKKIGATGQGATPEYILNYILTENGIDPATDCEIEYYAEHSELATHLASGNVDIGVLPEPNVTSAMTKGEDLRIALNLTEEWGKVAGEDSSLLQGCIVVRRDFAKSYPEALKTFLEKYKASVKYITEEENLDSAAQIIADQGIVPAAAVAKKALPNCNIMYLDGTEMKAQLSGFLKVLYDANPQAVGGALPDDAFYYGVD